MMKRVPPLLLTVTALAAACGSGNPGSASSGSGSGSGSGGSGGTSQGSVKAIVDGAAYIGTVNAASVNPSGNLTIASNNAALNLSVNLAMRAVVGTTDVSSGTTVLNVITTNGNTTTGSWSASALGGSGTLTITTLTASSATGTFSFTAVPVNTSSTGTKTVMTGTFFATF